MYDFNTTITASGESVFMQIISTSSTAYFSRLIFSENNYVGQEYSLNMLTFDGVFDSRSASATIIDSRNIKVSATINSPTQDNTLYSIGVVVHYQGLDYLVAVCTTSNPMPISQGAGNTYSFNVNISVSSTENITVVGTTAAALYDTDIVDNLVTSDPTKVLSANMGRVLNEKVESLTNPNLLDNPFFTINQRNATTITSGYGADRWKCDGGTSLTFSYGQVVITSAICRQVLDAQIPNAVYTASVKLADGTIHSGTAIKTNDTDVIEFLSDTSVRIVYNASTKGFGIDTANIGGVTTTILAVKLEVGTVSTLHLDVAPDYTTELLKCQREFYRKISKDNTNAYFASGICTSSTGFIFVIKLPCEMKSAPSISFSGTFYVTNGLVNIAVTSFVVAGFSGDTIGINALTSGGLTTGDGLLIYANNIGDYIDFTT